MKSADPDGRPKRTAAEEAVLVQAKELLMAARGLTEEQAHRYLQKQSMDCGLKMAETAQRILNENQPGKGA